MFSDILSNDEEFSDLFNTNFSDSFDEWDLESILAEDTGVSGLFSDEDLFGNGRSDDVDSNVVSGKSNNYLKHITCYDAPFLRCFYVGFRWCSFR